MYGTASPTWFVKHIKIVRIQPTKKTTTESKSKTTTTTKKTESETTQQTKQVGGDNGYVEDNNDNGGYNYDDDYVEPAQTEAPQTTTQRKTEAVTTTTTKTTKKETTTTTTYLYEPSIPLQQWTGKGYTTTIMDANYSDFYFTSVDIVGGDNIDISFDKYTINAYSAKDSRTDVRIKMEHPNGQTRTYNMTIIFE